MFIGILFLIVAVVVYLYARDWIYVSRRTPKQIQKTLQQITKHISFREWEEADALLKPLLANRKGQKNLSLFEIQVLQGTKRLEEALEKVLKASQEFPEELIFRLEEGKILLKLGKPKEALEALLVAGPIIRSETDISLLGCAFFQNGSSDKCLELIEPFLKTTQDGTLMALAADAYCMQKRFKEAILLYTKCMELGNTSAHIFVGLGIAYRRIGNLSEAERIFRKLLEKDPHNPELVLELGSCLQERGHFQKALLLYQSSDAWETKHPPLLKQAAFCALYAKKFAAAEKYLLEAIQNEQPSLEILSNYGYTLECQKKWQEAEQVYLRIVQLFPSSPQGYLALSWLFGVGLSCTLTQNQGLNFAHFALKLKNDLVAWEILSACEARVGNFERAYQIQQSLATYDEDKESKFRRQSALRSLRKQVPLGDMQVSKSQVA